MQEMVVARKNEKRIESVKDPSTTNREARWNLLPISIPEEREGPLVSSVPERREVESHIAVNQ
jgi:hypothetical protein